MIRIRNDAMKSILCYGDSNTWGAIPGNHRERYPRGLRWPGALQKILGENYLVFEEGLSGRTTVLEDPFEEGRSGKTFLLPCLRTHRPVDLVILMLGTNDLKARFSFTAYDIARGAGMLAGLARTSGAGPHNHAPLVLLIAPPPLGILSVYAEEFEGGTEKSQELSEYFRDRAREAGCEFLDAGAVIRSSPLDGIHFDQEEHAKLARAIAGLVVVMLDK
jgi:lysophospholipase L1-like esterase